MWHKLMHWEYWPSFVFNIPVVFFWLWHGLRARNIFFFSAANPVIETGGLLGESKEAIMQQVPDKYKPKSVFVPAGSALEAIQQQMESAVISFPVFGKPNIGERGFQVSKIIDNEQLRRYFEHNRSRDFLLQEYADFPVELSVLHYRFPDQQKGMISSVCLKKFLSITGDGVHTIAELIEAYPRARFQKKHLDEKWGTRYSEIPAVGEEIVLVPVGNHSRGAMFLDANDEIDEKLHRVFDDISHQLDGILFARYDLKCASIDALREGRDFAILEINGAGAEPAHIYDPKNSIWNAYRDMWKHWRSLYQVSRAQHKAGVPYMTWREARAFWRKHRQSLVRP
ncbi:MAG: hypothetical protein AB8F95_08570 [Bacteroidia bacterium]